MNTYSINNRLLIVAIYCCETQWNFPLMNFSEAWTDVPDKKRTGLQLADDSANVYKSATERRILSSPRSSQRTETVIKVHYGNTCTPWRYQLSVKVSYLDNFPKKLPATWVCIAKKVFEKHDDCNLGVLRCGEPK